MQAKKRILLENKLKSMDDQYWDRVADLTNILSSKVDMFLIQQKDAFTRLIVLDLQIAETKYLGYKSLLSEHKSVNDEMDIEDDFRFKINDLESNRRAVLIQIDDYYKRMYEYVLDPDMLENYVNEHTEATA